MKEKNPRHAIWPHADKSKLVK